MELHLRFPLRLRGWNGENSTVDILEHKASDDGMNGERWNGTDMRGGGRLIECPGVCSGELRSVTTNVGVHGLPAEINPLALELSF